MTSARLAAYSESVRCQAKLAIWIVASGEASGVTAQRALVAWLALGATLALGAWLALAPMLMAAMLLLGVVLVPGLAALLHAASARVSAAPVASAAHRRPARGINGVCDIKNAPR